MSVMQKVMESDYTPFTSILSSVTLQCPAVFPGIVPLNIVFNIQIIVSEFPSWKP